MSIFDRNAVETWSWPSAARARLIQDKGTAVAKLVGVQTWGVDGFLRDVMSDTIDVRVLCSRAAEHVVGALSGRSATVHADHGEHDVHCVFLPLRAMDGTISGALSLAYVSEEESPRRELRERLAFEELVTNLSTRFVSVTSEDLDASLNDALGEIGTFAGVDRAYIFRFTANGRAMDNTHEWCSPGTDPQIDTLQNLPLDSLPWWTRQLKARQVIHVPDVGQMGPEFTAEKTVLDEQKVRSVLAIPMVLEDSVVGFVGFDSVRERKQWAETDIALLRIAGEIFMSALERARAERERRELEAELVRARSLENVARLAGGVAHDFNNLLAVILNYTTLLRREIVDPAQREKLDELFSAARSAADLTRQLLVVGRRDIVEPMLLDLSDVVSSLRGLLKQTRGDSIELRLELGTDLETVRVGLPQVEQVIVNLTLNARDAMLRGGTLTIRTENVLISPDHAARFIDVVPGRYVRIRVLDDGVGMSPDVEARAFEPFFTTKGAGGTGLGLPSVHGVVKRAGGHVELSTRTGFGTTVDIYLPSVVHQMDATCDEPPPPSSPVGRGETVLVVEDSATLRKIVCTLLADNRYRPIEAATPEEAVAACERGPVDMLLTDVIMPQMSGRDLAQRLREDHGIVRVLYMTGYDDAMVAHHGVEGGPLVLQKPFLEGDLLRAVRRVLDGPEARSSASA